MSTQTVNQCLLELVEYAEAAIPVGCRRGLQGLLNRSRSALKASSAKTAKATAAAKASGRSGRPRKKTVTD